LSFDEHSADYSQIGTAPVDFVAFTLQYAAKTRTANVSMKNFAFVPVWDK
jgi:hypothetical protein